MSAPSQQDQQHGTKFPDAISGLTLPAGYVIDGATGQVRAASEFPQASFQGEVAGQAQLPLVYDRDASADAFAQVLWTYVDTALAKEWIGLPPLSGEDRRLDMARVRGYARDMVSQRWHPSPSTTPIQLSLDGSMRANGLHRLTAILYAHDELDSAFTGINCPVTYSDEIRGLDTGKPRSVADAFTAGYAQHVSYLNDIAAIARWAVAIDTGQVGVMRADFWTHDELCAYMDANLDGIGKAVSRGRRYSAALRSGHRIKMAVTTLGTAHFLIERASPAKCDAFFTWLTGPITSDAKDAKWSFLNFAGKKSGLFGPEKTPRLYSRDDRLAVLLSVWLQFDAGRTGRGRYWKIPENWSAEPAKWPGRSLRRHWDMTARAA